MSDPDLQISMENGIAEVGSPFRGRVTLSGQLDDLAESSKQSVRAVRVSLRYYTQGRGDRDSQTVVDHQFPVDTYGRVDRAFELPVPAAGPISYDGRLIRVLWEIEARVDIKRRRDAKTIVPVLVIPDGGWGLYDRPHPLRR